MESSVGAPPSSPPGSKCAHSCLAGFDLPGLGRPHFVRSIGRHLNVRGVVHPSLLAHSGAGCGLPPLAAAALWGGGGRLLLVGG